MDCNEARALVTAYVDGEVGVSDARAVEAHLRACVACQEERDVQRALKQAVATHAGYARAPSSLADGITAALAAEDAALPDVTAPSQPAANDLSPARPATNDRRPSAAARGPRWTWAPGLVTAAMAASLAAIVWTTSVYVSLPSAEERIGSELVASHVRSLISGRNSDVASSDQHTVKPWFNGKIDYAPPVHDLAGDGFPLLGGRADYIDHRKVATLIYGRRLHVVDVYVWPDATPDAEPHRLAKDGYHLLGWRHGGMQYWAVSDTEASDLDALRNALDKQT